MKLSDLYQNKLELIAMFLDKGSKASNFEAQDYFRSTAFKFQGQAGYIAHLMALHGDLVIEDMDIPWHLTQTMNIPCEGENPWARGIRVVQQWLAPSE